MSTTARALQHSMYLFEAGYFSQAAEDKVLVQLRYLAGLIIAGDYTR